MGNIKKTVKKATKRKPKAKPITHIVVWDTYCGDPARTFTSLELAKKFVVDELLNLNGKAKDHNIDPDDIKKESIKIFEVSGKIGKVSVIVEF